MAFGNFGDAKRRLQALINRKDLSDDLAGDFVTSAIADMERVLRIGPMERVLVQDTWDGTANVVVIPPDFLENINFFTDDCELEQIDLAKFIKMNPPGTTPTHFVKVADKYLLKPTPAPGTQVYLHHYCQSPKLVVDTDENVWTQSAFNAVLYTAAGLASDYFQMEDEYAQRFGQKAGEYIQALLQQDNDEKWAGRLAIPLPQDTGAY